MGGPALVELGHGVDRNPAQKLVHGSKGWGLGQVLFQLVLFSQVGNKVISSGERIHEQRGKAADWRDSRFRASWTKAHCLQPHLAAQRQVWSRQPGFVRWKFCQAERGKEAEVYTGE